MNSVMYNYKAISFTAFALFLVALCLPGAVFAAADTCTWTGSSSGNWASAANWGGCDNGNVPESGDSLIFPGNTPFTTSMVNNLTAGFTFESIAFTGAWSYEVVSGNNFALGATGITTAANSAVEFHNNVDINTDTIVNANGSFRFNGQVTIAAGQTLTMNVAAGTSRFTATSTLLGSGTLDKQGPQTLFLSNTNSTFAGNINVSGGSLLVADVNALGTNDTCANSTVATGMSGSSADINLSFSGTTGECLISSAGGDMWLNGVSGLTLTRGILVPGGGSNRLYIANPVTFTGTAHIDMALVNNANITTLFVSNAELATFQTGMDLYLGINATTSDKLSLIDSDSDSSNDSINLNNITLNLVVAATPDANVTYTLINNTGLEPIIGTFAGLPEGSTITVGGVDFGISYKGGDGHDVVLSLPVPEIINLYRFFSNSNGTHFYTRSTTERDKLINTMPQYSYEGVIYQVFRNNTIANPNVIPVYRFYNTLNGAHFYTSSLNERNKVMANFPWFNYEGPNFYVYAKTASFGSPVYRFFNTRTNTHFYTKKESEKTKLQGPNYSYFNFEGIAYKVP
jgi:autotransporter-associated beta strand protein